MSEEASKEAVKEKFRNIEGFKEDVKQTFMNGSGDYERESEAEGYRMRGDYPWDDTPFQDPEFLARLTAPASVTTLSSIAQPFDSQVRNISTKDGDVNHSIDLSCRGESRSVSVVGTLRAINVPRYKLPQLSAPATTHTHPFVHAPAPAPAPAWLPVPVSLSAPLPLSFPLPAPTTIPIPIPIPLVPVSMQPLNYFSLYWIKKSGLPCIRTDWSNGQVNCYSSLNFEISRASRLSFAINQIMHRIIFILTSDYFILFDAQIIKSKIHYPSSHRNLHCYGT